jgi:hypothetical protein
MEPAGHTLAGSRNSLRHGRLVPSSSEVQELLRRAEPAGRDSRHLAMDEYRAGVHAIVEGPWLRTRVIPDQTSSRTILGTRRPDKLDRGYIGPGMEVGRQASEILIDLGHGTTGGHSTRSAC